MINLSLLYTRFDKLTKALLSGRMLRALVRYRVLAGTEHRHVLCSDLATVVDIGANKGQFSLAAREYAPAARVVAFEPLSGAADIYRKVFEVDSLATLHQAAIGPEKRESAIHVSEADDSSSLLPISGLQVRLFPGTGEVRTETIKVGRLADFVSAQEIISPALLKIDVQGYELEALRGCDDLLDSFMYVYVECSFVELYTGQALAHDVIEWLAERGFKLTGVYNVCYDEEGRAVQGDFLFKKNMSERKQ